MVFLQQYFAVEPLKEPQVWIRIILNRGDEKIHQFIAEKTLSHGPRPRLIAALDAEKKRTLAEGKTWPAEFESLLRVRNSR
jgi:hypothetical protein